MAYANSNTGYIGIGAQNSTAWLGNMKTTWFAPAYYVPYISDSITPEIRDEMLFQGSDPGKYDIAQIKMQHTEKIAFSCYAYPKLTAGIYSAMMGVDAVTSLAGTPKVHTITFKTTDLVTTPMSPWQSITKCLVTSTQSLVQEITGCKINSVTMSAEAGSPVLLEVEGRGISSSLTTTTLTPTYEAGLPYSMYHSVLYVNASNLSTTCFDVKSFNVKITCENDEMQDGSFGLHDIFNNHISAEVDLTLNYVDYKLWQKAHYAGVTTISETYANSWLKVVLETSAGINRETAEINFPRIRIKPHLLALDPNVKTVEQPFSGVALKYGATELVTVTCRLAVTTTLPL